MAGSKTNDQVRTLNTVKTTPGAVNPFVTNKKASQANPQNLVRKP